MAQLPLPPAVLPAPATVRLAAGTRVWRVHLIGRGADVPNATAQRSARAGGRFDSIDGSYGYLYLGDSPDAAVAETICRDLPVDQSPRLIPVKQIADRKLTEVEISDDLVLADLTGAGTARINAGGWLTHCDRSGYLTTRRWAAAIFAAYPELNGLQYRPRHDDNRIAWMLTYPPGQTRAASLGPGFSLELDTAEGRALLAPILAEHNAALPPR